MNFSNNPNSPKILIEYNKSGTIENLLKQFEDENNLFSSQTSDKEIRNNRTDDINFYHYENEIIYKCNNYGKWMSHRYADGFNNNYLYKTNFKGKDQYYYKDRMIKIFLEIGNQKDPKINITHFYRNIIDIYYLTKDNKNNCDGGHGFKVLKEMIKYIYYFHNKNDKLNENTKIQINNKYFISPKIDKYFEQIFFKKSKYNYEIKIKYFMDLNYSASGNNIIFNKK